MVVPVVVTVHDDRSFDRQIHDLDSDLLELSQAPPFEQQFTQIARPGCRNLTQGQLAP
jgi:hypothetical protein